MKPILVTAVCFVALSCAKAAEVALPNAVAGRSVSGQFQIYTPRWDPALRPPVELTSRTNYLELEPALLTISCERVKQALHRELGITAPTWRGRIHLTLRRATAADEPVYIVSEKIRDGWAYHVGLPQVVERQRFIRGLVQVLLLEQANRRSTGRSAEIPVWLSEGLTQLLLLRPDVELTPSPTRWDKNGVAIGPTVFDIRRVNPHKQTVNVSSAEELAGLKRVIWLDPLEEARRVLRSRPPLTLEELTWPADEQQSPSGELYRRSAELFVAGLLRLEHGREDLRGMVDELAGCYNWQTAFFRTFKSHFRRQLDLEKWWALQVVHFTGRDPTELWSPEESLQRLDKILRTPIEVRHAANELPARTDAPLQSIIREWEPNQQLPALKNKVRDLEMFRLRAATQIVPLADDYRKALQTYLGGREKIDFAAVARRSGQRRLHAAAQEAIKQLDALDARRDALRPQEEPSGVQSAQNGEPPP